MFDKDEETEKGWEDDIKLDFEEECAQYGKIINVVVMSKEVGRRVPQSVPEAWLVAGLISDNFVWSLLILFHNCVPNLHIIFDKPCLH